MANAIRHDVDVGENLLEPLETWDEEGVAHEETIGLEGDGEYIEVDGESGHHLTNEYIVEDPQGESDNLGMPMSTAAALLPMRNGRPVLSMNLPELMSRQVSLENEGVVFLCFSKRCLPQLAFDGYIYNINGNLSDTSYNIWRCSNENCPGAVRTSPHFESLKIRCDHMHSCSSDDVQVRLRIYVYDLRLMAEFTDIDLFSLFKAYLDKVRNEQPDLLNIFPPFESLRLTLEHHRLQLIYRKRFEVRKLSQIRQDQGLPHMARRESTSQTFKRTKAFPASICTECNAHLPSSELVPSQDILIEHITFQHERPLVIERYQFPEITLFEQWIRELQQHSRYRMRKMGLYDENMYYLCQSDDRQHRSNHGKGSLVNIQCSAFVRVHDWRYHLRREVRPVIVDYCLDHTFHSGSSPFPDVCRSPVYDYYSPEVFLRELDERRARTSRLLSSNENLQHIKRVAYQQNPSSQMVTVPAGATKIRYKPVHSNTEEHDMSPVHGNDVSHSNTIRDNASSSRINLRNTPGKQVVTSRNNFDNDQSFDAVRQLELQCDVIKQRMQNCRKPEVARKYLVRVTALLDDILADPQCAPRRSEMPSVQNSLAADKREFEVSTSDQGTIRKSFCKRGPNGELIVIKRVFRRVQTHGEEAATTRIEADEAPEDVYVDCKAHMNDQLLIEEIAGPSMSQLNQGHILEDLTENLLDGKEKTVHLEASDVADYIDHDDHRDNHIEETNTSEQTRWKRSATEEPFSQSKIRRKRCRFSP